METRTATSESEFALYLAQNWGRDYYRNRMVKISQVDDAAFRAERRLRNIRSESVRRNAVRILNHNRGVYRWYRYLLQASMADLTAIANHPLFNSAN
jgi:hypothetical protein